jgi:hypothetical protein
MNAPKRAVHVERCTQEGQVQSVSVRGPSQDSYHGRAVCARLIASLHRGLGNAREAQVSQRRSIVDSGKPERRPQCC